MTQTKLYEAYAIIEAEIAALEEKKEMLRGGILKEMIESGADKVDTPFGKFTSTKLKKWKYTNKVDELKEAYTAQKALEESTGEATYEEVPSLRFTKIKL